MSTRIHADKRAAIEQWTADPCGAEAAGGEPGSREYAESLLAARQAYAPWMEAALSYEDARGLDVLDVGCGQGIDLVRYARAGAKATGVDLTPRHVELASLNLAALELAGTVVEGDAERLPFASESFDRVSSNGVLHHSPDLPAAFREVLRVLRSGGEARIVLYNRNSLHYWLKQVVTEGVLRGGLLRERSMAGVLSRGVERSTVGARPLVRVYSPRQVRTELERAGFAEVRSFVRHFQAGDTPPTRLLAGRLRALRDERVLDRIGRVGGWYVVGVGRRP